MNKLIAFAFCTAASFALAGLAAAQNSDFPGVQRAMSPQAFDAAGLNKLSPEERARLDEFIRGYAQATSEKAATAAVDQAAREGKVRRNEPEIVQSALVGRFTGYSGRDSFTLENGQVYKQSQQVSRSFPPVDSPPVLVVKGTSMLAGYRMYIAGGGNIRVVRVK
jgi:hypothetical protein